MGGPLLSATPFTFPLSIRTTGPAAAVAGAARNADTQASPTPNRGKAAESIVEAVWVHRI